MASISFAKSPRHANGYTSLADADSDEADKLPRDKEVVYRSSSGVESSKSTTKSRKKQTTSTSEAERSSGANKSTLSSKKKRKPREAAIASPSPSSGLKDKVISWKYGSVDEKEPLLQADERNAKPDEHLIVNIPNEEDESGKKKSKASNTQRFWSTIVFLLPLITGCSLIISVNVKTDTAAREINPAVFHYYMVGLIIVFFLWLGLELYHNLDHNWNRKGKGENFEPLIPSHLLNGLALFGVCNSAFQVIMAVDFVKCSRSVSGLDKSYVVSAFFEMIFVFCQIYIFYTLSRRRNQKLWFGNHFTMFTLAINLTLWGGYFCAGAVNHPDLHDVTWLRRYYYGQKVDLCARLNITGNSSRKLHELVSSVMQYKFTFAMEYSLLASALLFHLWLEIATPSAGEFGATNKRWEVWRFGFIAGLFSLPLIGVICAYSTVKYSSSNAAILYTVKFGLFFLVFLCSVVGLILFKCYYRRVTETKVLKVDTILLCLSSVGFLILDLFTIFATIAETLKSYDGDTFLMGVASLGELITTSLLTTFIFASYFYQIRLSEGGVKAAKNIRQIASFCITVSFGFWAMRTYTFRSDYSFDYVGHTYFGKTAWFAITQFATPMCIFYHFHCAVCLSGIIADSTGTVAR